MRLSSYAEQIFLSLNKNLIFLGFGDLSFSKKLTGRFVGIKGDSFYKRSVYTYF